MPAADTATNIGGFARTIAAASGIDEVLRDLCDRATVATGDRDTGVGLVRGDHSVEVTSGEWLADELARVQERAGDGPTASVQRGEQAVVARLGDLRGRWPAYVGEADRLGVEWIMTLPMRSTVDTIGTLAVYRSTAVGWDDDVVASCGALVDMTASFVVTFDELERQRRTAEQLQQALDSRVIIEQAKGMIAVDNSVTINEAFAILRGYSRDRRVSIHVVAHAVVDHGLRPQPIVRTSSDHSAKQSRERDRRVSD